ncbi:Disease resistance protein TAO1 [Linum perenne]
MITMHPSAYAKVKDLIDISLLTCVSSENGEKIEVHDLLKEMAWNIVNEEPKLGKRSRLVDPDDIHKLLTTWKVKNWSRSAFNPNKKVIDMHWKGNDPLEEQRTTKGIHLDLSKAADEMYLEANAFEGMDFLTFLKFEWPKIQYSILKKKIQLSYGDLNSLPEGLRWLQWDGYSLNSLPSNFYPQHLVHLIIRRSPIQKCWEGNDQTLCLHENCLLESLPNSIWNMISHGLELHVSPLITSLPEILEPVNGLNSLFITECRGLRSLPSTIGNLKSLSQLILSSTGIRSLPYSIKELGQLVSINLDDCQRLYSLPASIHKVPKLVKLVIGNCGSIRSLPELPPNLEILELVGCKSLRTLPINTSKWLHMKFIRFDDCPRLNENILVEIVANFLVHASLSLSPKCELHFSRSELPEWFSYKSMNLKEEEDCSVKVELPLPGDSNQPMIKGIVFGAVYSFDQTTTMRCDCEAGNTTVASWSKFLWPTGVGESENIWLVFDRNLSGESAIESNEDEEWYVKYAGLAVSFRFYFDLSHVEKSKNLKIKGCGVSLLY